MASQVKSQLYERQVVANKISNFENRLPIEQKSKPIGVSEYHLCTDLPLDLKSALPDPEEIRSRIDMKNKLCRPSAQMN